LDRPVPDAAIHGQANAEGVSELAPIFCGFVPTLAAEPLWEPNMVPRTAFLVVTD
jgi:hypothetical protein